MRKTSIPIQVLTVTLSEIVGSNILVDFDGSLPSAGSIPYGACPEGGAIGDVVAVGTDGVFPVVADGVILKGASVACTAVGKVKAPVATQALIGVAQDAAADGELVSIKFKYMGVEA